MIAIDTNVLLRYLLDDHPAQSARAARLIEGEVPVLVTDVVLAETIWTLKGAKYQLDKPALLDTLEAIFKEPNIRLEDIQVAWVALDHYRKSKGVDFADALIVGKASSVADRLGVTFVGMYTFDKAAQKMPGTMPP